MKSQALSSEHWLSWSRVHRMGKVEGQRQLCSCGEKTDEDLPSSMWGVLGVGSTLLWCNFYTFYANLVNAKSYLESQEIILHWFSHICTLKKVYYRKIIWEILIFESHRYGTGRPEPMWYSCCLCQWHGHVSLACSLESCHHGDFGKIFLHSFLYLLNSANIIISIGFIA